MIVRKTEPQEAAQVNRLFAMAFELPQSTGPAKEDREDLTSWAAFSEDGTMMSTLTVTDYTVGFDGHSCRMGGVGGVATLPQYRRCGGIRACFQHCLPELYDRGFEFSYLYPFSNAFYRQFGYESCVQKFEAAVDLSLLKPRASGCRFCLCQEGQTFRQAISQIQRTWESRFNLSVLHKDEDFVWADAPDPAGTLSFTYVVFDEEDRPAAYTTFRTERQSDGRNLLCSRFYFLDPQGFQGLMELFKTMASDHRFVKFQLPADQGLAYLLPEWSMDAISLRFVGAGMVRVVDAQSVLKKAACRGTGALRLALLDPLIPQNNGCFQLCFRDGQVITAEKTELEPQIRLTVPAFSALITGAGDLRWMSGVEVLDPSAPLSQIFYRKDRMITDFF